MNRINYFWTTLAAVSTALAVGIGSYHLGVAKNSEDLDVQRGAVATLKEQVLALASERDSLLAELERAGQGHLDQTGGHVLKPTQVDTNSNAQFAVNSSPQQGSVARDTTSMLGPWCWG